eukprot:1213741-Pleurochrysis_carterae.AAC.1
MERDGEPRGGRRLKGERKGHAQSRQGLHSGPWKASRAQANVLSSLASGAIRKASSSAEQQGSCRFVGEKSEFIRSLRPCLCARAVT